MGEVRKKGTVTIGQGGGKGTKHTNPASPKGTEPAGKKGKVTKSDLMPEGQQLE